MTEEAFRDILKRYEEGTCSREERLLVESWFAYRANSSPWEWNDPEEREQIREMIRLRIVRSTFPGNLIKKFGNKKRMIAIAASIMIVACTWHIYQREHKRAIPGNVISFHNKQSDWAGPGTKVALLTLSNGQSVRLDELEKKQAFVDNGVLIKSDKVGHLVYYRESDGKPTAQNAISWNTISIPFGSQYKVSLPDGTVVWLNSATTLKYPTHFSGNKRGVILNGEAYFEIAQKANSPFVVETAFTNVEATGTAFNLKAYADEYHVQTTLLEGGVNVSTAHAVVQLKPGQMAVSSVNEDAISTNSVELENVVAWREGYFVFDDMDIRAIMKCLERWYHMEAVFRGPISSQRFGGTFTMKKDVAELLDYLEQISHLSFKVDERRIIVEEKS